jgi:hypothetical protein
MRFLWLSCAVVPIGLAASVINACTSGPPAAPDVPAPAVPEAGATTTQSVLTFAIDRVTVGDTTDGISFDTNAWSGIGYDLDGKETTKTSADVCTLMQGAPRDDQVDGVGGRDNAFGSVMVPVLTELINPFCLWQCDGGPPPRFISNVETLQIQVTGLSDDPSQNALGLTAQVFSSGVFDADAGAAPSFDTTTDWPVQPESLTDPTNIDGGASATFSSAYVSNGTLVAGVNESVTVPFHVELDSPAFHGGTFPVTLLIHSAIITFDHTSHGEAANGVIAGVLDPQELTASIKQCAGQISTSLCGNAFNGIEQQLAFGTEILLDRSNHAGVPCTGISIGMGFHATLIANPTAIAPATTTAPDPCASDGGDASPD